VVPERLVRFPVRTILTVLVTVIGVAVALEVIWISRHVIVWILISLFLALAMNPAVDFFQRHGIERRGLAAGLTYILVLAGLAAIGALFVPTVVHQVTQFVDKVPDYVDDLTKGRGRLGFLETKYHIVERVRHAVKSGGARKALGLSGTAVSVAKGVITIVVGIVTVAFLTFFMLLEGPKWVERFFGLLPDRSQPRWRKVAHGIYGTVGGYVTGNLLISVVAGGSTTIVLLILGVLGAVAFLHSILAGIVVVIFFVVYQQIENHLLQPLVYGRTVQLSPLVVLVAVLIGAELAGILGALGAIPVAGAIQVVVVDQLQHRRAGRIGPAPDIPQTGET
jgi:predicted PurR-regulated permease PerM